MAKKSDSRNAEAIENVDVEKLVPYARNARTHSASQVAQIAASIREFGFLNPVLIDEEGTIIAGHGRVLAAQKLELAQVPCVRLAHLSEVQRRAYVLADNKLALNAGWDENFLRIELEALGESGFDIEIAGFTEKERGDILSGLDLDLGTGEIQAKPDMKKITIFLPTESMRSLKAEIKQMVESAGGAMVD